MESQKKCLNCGKMNHEANVICRCGYEFPPSTIKGNLAFSTQKNLQSRPTYQNKEIRTRQARPPILKAINWILLFLSIGVAGAQTFHSFPSYLNKNSDASFVIWSWGGWGKFAVILSFVVGGIPGVVLAIFVWLDSMGLLPSPSGNGIKITVTRPWRYLKNTLEKRFDGKDGSSQLYEISLWIFGMVLMVAYFRSH